MEDVISTVGQLQQGWRVGSMVGVGGWVNGWYVPVGEGIRIVVRLGAVMDLLIGNCVDFEGGSKISE